MYRILFYSVAILASAKGEADATLDDIRATGKALSASTGAAVMLRDIDYFDGKLERPGDQYPEEILLLGPEPDDEDDDNEGYVFNAVRQAYHEVGVSARHVSLHVEGEESEKESDPTGDAMNVTEFDLLKARATELGIHFSSQIGEASLRGRVEAKEKELQDADGGDA